MLKYYAWDTSNGRKAAILLEELGIKYQYHGVNINKGEQFSDEFKALNPNSKIPLLIDDENNITLSESGAILMYLAEMHNPEFYPKENQKRYQVIKWLMFQMSSIGPMFGQALHFFKYTNEEIPYGVKRYVSEVHRLLNVMDKHLENKKYFAK